MREARANLGLRDAARPLVARLALAKAEHKVAAARPDRRREAFDEGGAVFVAENVKQAAIEDRIELLAERSFKSKAFATRKRTVRPRSRALRSAVAIAVGAVSTPTASSPSPAAIKACSPVPQPTSSTWPRTAPASASCKNAGCGRPMSHGGVAA